MCEEYITVIWLVDFNTH